MKTDNQIRLMKSSLRNLLSTLALVLALTASLPARAADEKAKEAAQQATQNFLLADPGLGNFFTNSAGYAILPNVGEGGFLIGAEHGKGLVYAKGKLIGKVTLTEVSVGLQAGGGTFAEVVFFETADALNNFKQSQFTMNAQAKAAVAASGVAAAAKYQQGVAVFTLPKNGAMVNASVGGQKLKFEALK